MSGFHKTGQRESSLPKKSSIQISNQKSNGPKSISSEAATAMSSVDYYSPKSSTDAVNRVPSKQIGLNSPGKSKETPQMRSSTTNMVKKSPARSAKRRHSFDIDCGHDYEYD